MGLRGIQEVKVGFRNTGWSGKEEFLGSAAMTEQEMLGDDDPLCVHAWW